MGRCVTGATRRSGPMKKSSTLTARCGTPSALCKLLILPLFSTPASPPPQKNTFLQPFVLNDLVFQRVRPIIVTCKLKGDLFFAEVL